MAGSRKGEQRGGLRRTVNAQAKKAADALTPVEPKVKKPRKPKSSPIRTDEYYREITRVVTGVAMEAAIEPRDVMLEAMRYFHGLANESRQQGLYIMAQLAKAETEADFAMIDAALASTDLRTREMYLLAIDCGFKVAPYCHSKLSTMEISGPDKGPIEIVGTLLAEIADAGRGRPSWAPETLDLEAEEVS